VHKMKILYKSLIPFFGVSFSLSNNNVSRLEKNVIEPKEIFISTKLEKKVDLQDRGKLTFEKEKNILNQTKVFLLVKKTVSISNKQKLEKNVLLLLDPEDRINAHKHNYNIRQDKHIIHTQHHLDKNTKKHKQPNSEYIVDSYSSFNNESLEIKRNFDYGLGLEKSFFKSIFRGGKSYFVRAEGGYKSICPVFLDENSAKNFLIEKTEEDVENLIERRNRAKGQSRKSKQFQLSFFSYKIKIQLPSFSRQKIERKGRFPKLMENVNNVKIIRLGLGDFIEYYSTFPNENALEKVDFFFVPNLEPLITQSTRKMPATKEDQTTKIIGKNKIKLKGFKSYQKQLYGIRK
jgi:hypothetical protein